ncbi:MAG TPA: hypothetical protein VIF62_27605 [Labilithrix sp.]
MRPSLFAAIAAVLAAGCSAAPGDETTSSTASAMSIPTQPINPLIPRTPQPAPIVFQSISGYAGFPLTSGHSNGPTVSSFVRPTHVSSNASGTTWVVDEDPNDPNLGYVRVVSDTIGGVNGAHVQTAFDLYDIGFGPWNMGGLVVAANGTDAFVSDSWGSAIYKISIGQTRTRLAGGYQPYGGYYFTPTAGFTDGPANTARFNTPNGLAIDAAGNVWVADTGNHAIRKVTPSGDVSTFAVASTSSPSFDPKWIALAPDGSIWATSHTAIYHVTAGHVSLIAGSPTTSGSADGPIYAALFGDPKGIAVDRVGDVYVADSSNHCVRKIVAWSSTVSTIPTLPAFDAFEGQTNTYGPDDNVLDMPWGLSLWGDRLVVTDANRLTVRTMNPAAPNATHP